jgi:nitroreductase
MDTPSHRQPVLELIGPASMGLDAGLPPNSMVLLELLKQRRSSREFSTRKLDRHTLSRLIWSAFGINRPADGGRTAPSARDGQEISVYVALADGLFLFDPQRLVLLPVLSEDVRAETGMQDFVATAPVNLIYVARLRPEEGSTEQDQLFYAALDTGFIGQNVYLFCAAEGLATVVRGWIDRPALAQRMQLAQDQHIIAAQCVGYPSGSNDGLPVHAH